MLCEDQPVRVIGRDLELIRRARREGWLRDPQDMQRIADRVVKIALTSPDEVLAVRAAAEIRQMVAQDREYEDDKPSQQIEHHHTHDIGPVTESNIEAQRAVRLARLAGRV